MLNQLVRYEPVVQLVRELENASVLEVGSGSAGLARWLGDRPVTALDTSFDDYGARDDTPPRDGTSVRGDAMDMPFPDASFDVVVALDVLEHIARIDRPRVLAELARTARRRVVVGCPTGCAAFEADERLAERLTRRGHDLTGTWLAEHLERGFPTDEELVEPLRPFGVVRTFGNENIRAHERLMAIEATRPGLIVTRWIVRALAAGVRRPTSLRARLLWVIRGRDEEPTYRTIVVLDRQADRDPA